MRPVDSLPLLPVEDDRDTGGFFEAARRGVLVVKVCSACGQVLHLPRQHCFACGSALSQWRPVRGTGRLHSWTVVEHQVHPAFPVPYTVVLVDLDDVEARFVGMLPGRPELQPGVGLTVRFDQVPDGTVLPQWDLDRR
jgi:uncharacterized OB-fold protein